MREPIHYISEIGLWSFSRGCLTCRWKTPWCKENCYNLKFYSVNPKLPGIDRNDNDYWRLTHAQQIARRINDLKIARFRFAVRGEIWNTSADVMKVNEILRRCPNTLFWIPTRAWRHAYTREVIEALILPQPNSRVMASIDKTTLGEAEVELIYTGWSTVFTGDNSDPKQMFLDGSENRTAKYMKCPKTWKHWKGYCRECKDGCFSAKQVSVHLKEHK